MVGLSDGLLLIMVQMEYLKAFKLSFQCHSLAFETYHFSEQDKLSFQNFFVMQNVLNNL